MPIIHKTKDIVPSPRWPELGRFYLGDPQKKVKRGDKEVSVVGRNRKDFRLEWKSPLVKDDHQRLATWNRVMLELFGESPQVLRGIRFLANDPDQVFETWYEQYAGRSVVIRCDGERQLKHWEQARSADEKAHYSFDPIPCLRDSQAPCTCTMVGRLHFSIPAFTQATKMLGQFSIRTGSGRNLDQIWNMLADAHQKGIDLTRIDWVLSRKEGPTTFATDEGAPAASTNWFVELSMDEDYIQAALDRMEVGMLKPGGGSQIGPGAGQEAELIDLDDYDAMAAEDFIEAEEILDFPPEHWILEQSGAKLTKPAVERVYARAKALAKQHSLAIAQEDVFYILGVTDFGMDSFPFSEEVALDALETGALAMQMGIKPGEVAQAIGADQKYIWGYCFAHGEDARRILKDLGPE